MSRLPMYPVPPVMKIFQELITAIIETIAFFGQKIWRAGSA
jgi:hypothetical protein